MNLPINFDRTPEGKYTKSATFGSKAYTENVQYFFRLDLSATSPIVQYYSEDDELLEGEELRDVLKTLGYL